MPNRELLLDQQMSEVFRPGVRITNDKPAPLPIELTESDVFQINETASELTLEGERLPEAALNMTGL